MGINTDLFSAFAAVVEHGSVGKAAQALHATQPTVSRQIGSLERQLGIALFERDQGGMRLTAAGADLLPHARHILHETALATEAADAHRGLLRGAVRVGGVTSVARSFLPPIAAEVARRAPHLRIEIVVGSEEQLDRALAQREIDVVLATAPPEEVETVEIGTRRYVDRCVVFCAADHPLHKHGEITPAQVLDHGWALGHPGATTRRQFERLVRNSGLEAPDVALQTDSVDVIISVVSRTRIMGWLPEPILQQAGPDAAIRALELPELELERTFRAYRRSRGTFPAGGQVLLDAMAAAFA